LTSGADDLHPNGTDTIVLIHGLWVTALIWERWIARYRARGYRVLAPGWPGPDRGVGELRRDPSGIARLRVTDIAAHYGHLIGGLSPPPATRTASPDPQKYNAIRFGGLPLMRPPFCRVDARLAGDQSGGRG
jgi:Alpha/beta hydrolase family